MFRQTETLTNEFEAATVTCKVEENFDTSTNKKTDVSIKNTGNVNAYLRVRVVSYWQDSKGNAIYDASPEIPIEVNGNWVKDSNENTYYYKLPVEPNASTDDLLNEMSITLSKREETVDDIIYTYYSVVEFIAEAIQAEPSTAVTESWGVTVDANGIITGLK